MSLHLIQNATSQLCSSDIFLDMISSYEEEEHNEPDPPSRSVRVQRRRRSQSPSPPPSPVFKPRSEPYQDIVYDMNWTPSYYYIWVFYDGSMYGHEKYMTNKSRINKNHNYHMRRSRRLKQPGGASCNQRR